MFYFDNTNKLVYLDSLNVKVFPSGRRKSELDTNTKQYIPIDPEARLNTEANHRKHSGLNGYKQSYILDWTDEHIKLVLNGYFFDIKLQLPDDDFSKYGETNFQRVCGYLADNLKYIDAEGKEVIPNEIFANILTADTTFFTSIDSSNTADSAVGTEILRDQAFTSESSPYLDWLKVDVSGNKLTPTKAANYYFTGLSFSADDLKKIKKDTLGSGLHAFSLQILYKDSDTDTWKVYEPSKLPVIEHGETENSVKIPGDLYVTGNVNVDGTVTAKEVLIDGMKAITMEVVQMTTDTGTAAANWQLRFNNAKVTPLE